MIRTRASYLMLAISGLCLCIAVSSALSDMGMKEDNDVQFLQDAATSNSWMITLGELALRQAASRDVIVFSRQMVEDQGRIGQDLKRLSDRKGIKLAADNDIVRLNTTEYLSKEYGAAFDRLYMSLLSDEHQRDAVLYKKEAEKGQDDDIKAYAVRTMKKFEEYAVTAKKILADIPKPLLK